MTSDVLRKGVLPFYNFEKVLAFTLLLLHTIFKVSLHNKLIKILIKVPMQTSICI